VLDLAAHVHALREEVFPDALERIEAGDLHRDLLEEGGARAFFLLFVGHPREHQAVVVGAEAQEGHAFFVDVRDPEAEEARVEIDHLGQIAAIDADVADLADADGVVGVGHFELLPRRRIACSAWKNQGSSRFDSVDNVHRNIGNMSSAAIPLIVPS
jgi:hypothetical protein